MAVLKAGTVELPVVALFSAVVSVWASLFTEFWKRREAKLALLVNGSDDDCLHCGLS